MCKKSESIANLAVALVKFNGEVKIIEKDAKNPHFKNNYATLDNIVDEIRPLLAQHGLSVLQFPGGDGEVFTLKTMLIHESGEWIESDPIVMRPAKNDPQGIGSCATYARRYSLAAMLSLNTGEDDDGNAASGNPANQGRPNTPPSRQSAPQQAPSAPRSQPAASGSKSKVIDHCKQNGISWSDLAKASSQALNRPIRVVKDEVQTEAEWADILRYLTGAAA